VKNLVVACPSFVSDCLETLEEIGMELKELFMKNGGESFDLVPCVNDSDHFVQGLAEQLRK
jgi:protoporphyrin/coproporphyrin ferrochelatase